MQGVIDYRDADWHSPMWWKRWRYLVQAMEEQSYEKMLNITYKFQLALVSNSRISAEDFSNVQREARELVNDLECQLCPWLGGTREERKKQEFQSFREQWKRAAGFDPSDREAVADWSQSIRDHMDRQQEQIQKEQQQQQEQDLNIKRIAEEIRQKRLRQQGRRL